MNEWMDEWMNGCMDAWMHGWMDEWMSLDVDADKPSCSNCWKRLKSFDWFLGFLPSTPLNCIYPEMLPAQTRAPGCKFELILWAFKLFLQTTLSSNQKLNPGSNIFWSKNGPWSCKRVHSSLTLLRKWWKGGYIKKEDLQLSSNTNWTSS